MLQASKNLSFGEPVMADKTVIVKQIISISGISRQRMKSMEVHQVAFSTHGL